MAMSGRIKAAARPWAYISYSNVTLIKEVFMLCHTINKINYNAQD